MEKTKKKAVAAVKSPTPLEKFKKMLVDNAEDLAVYFGEHVYGADYSDEYPFMPELVKTTEAVVPTGKDVAGFKATSADICKIRDEVDGSCLSDVCKTTLLKALNGAK
jgi:hypothetical protein